MKKILFIDDGQLTGKYFKRVVNEYDVSITDSLDAARQLLSEKEFDVVIVDYRFDNCEGSTENGLEFLKSQRFDNDPTTAICSAFHDIEDSLMNQGIHFIPKPIRYDEVKSWLATL